MVDLEQFREAVDFMLMHGTREQCIRAGDMLQAIIDNAGKVECPHDAWEENGGARRCADCRKYLGAMHHQPAPVVDDAMVERALNAKVRNWPVRQLFDSECEARIAMRAALTAALSSVQAVESP